MAHPKRPQRISEPMHSDKRAEARRRVRFRSGKLANPDGKFLSDCLIYDRSAEGARLRIAKSGAVPDRVLLFDDETSSLIAATVAWRRPNELGVRFMAELATPAAQAIARKLAGKYYAL